MLSNLSKTKTYIYIKKTKKKNGNLISFGTEKFVLTILVFQMKKKFYFKTLNVFYWKLFNNELYHRPSATVPEIT